MPKMNMPWPLTKVRNSKKLSVIVATRYLSLMAMCLAILRMYQNTISYVVCTLYIQQTICMLVGGYKVLL